MIQKARPELQKARPEFPKTYQVARRDTPSEVARRVALQSDAQYEVTVGGRERERGRETHTHTHTRNGRQKGSSNGTFESHTSQPHSQSHMTKLHSEAGASDRERERAGSNASREPLGWHQAVCPGDASNREQSRHTGGRGNAGRVYVHHFESSGKRVDGGSTNCRSH